MANQLPDHIKLEIVSMLACFTGPTDIRKHLRSEHDLDLPEKQIGSYDPTRSYYEAGEKWREIFDAKRKAYLEDVAAVPAANQGYRLNVLQKGIEAALAKGNYMMAANLSKQAAEEVGGVLTNQRHLNVDDARKQRARDMSPEERKDALAELVRQVRENMPPPRGADLGTTTTQ